ncbi:dolichol kinase [Hetaerina americana]|uniref:dolichol kinase n=1 Tax=Hetaerina americana TaxID=62018 RepID=UPI003A7F4D6B
MKKALKRISSNIDLSLKKSDLSTRPGASNGLWIAFLLPTIFVVIACRARDLSYSLRFVGIISSGLIGASAIFISNLATTEQNVRKFSALFYVPAVITSVLLLFLLKEGLLFCLTFGLGATFSYFIGLPILLGRFPNSFTFGEASVVAQALVIFVLTSTVNLISSNNPQGLSDVEKVTVILQVGLFGCGIIILCVSHLRLLRRGPAFYGTTLSVAFGFVVPLLHHLLQESPLRWIAQMIFLKPKAVILIVYWLCCCGVAILVVNYQLSKQKSASTVVRKNFHYLIVAVYIPGIFTDCLLLYLSSGVILALFMMMETVRVLRVPPLADVLQNSVAIFVDEKDQGIVALTPIYLLVGCSLPLWVHPDCLLGTPRGFLLALAGVLSVGIGDTAASVGGVRFGRHKWPGSKKSIEGTVISIFLQSLIVSGFAQFGFIPSSPSSLLRTFAAVTITSVLEALTDQVDNLVLPLVQLLLLL